jgi:hypothetical protein
MGEGYLFVSCRLSPGVDVVKAIRKKDISRADAKRPDLAADVAGL